MTSRAKDKDELPIYADEHFITDRFGIPVATLRTKRCRGGGPPFVKLGRSVRYKLADVEAWMDMRKIEP